MKKIIRIFTFVLCVIILLSCVSCTSRRERKGEVVAMHWNCTFYPWTDAGKAKEDTVLGAIFEYMPDFFTTSEGGFIKADIYSSKEITAYQKLLEKGYDVTGNKFTEVSQKVLDVRYNTTIFDEEFIACAKANDYFANIGNTTSTQIVYNAERFNLIKSGARLYCFSDRYTGTNTKAVSYGVFECKNPKDALYGKTFVVTATHFAVMAERYKELSYDWKNGKLHPYAHFESSIGTMWRQQNAEELKDFLDTLHDEYPDAIFMCGGDYNCGKDSSTLAVLEGSGYLTNAYNLAPEDNRDNGKSTHDQGKDSDPTSGSAIDHIFVNKDSSVVTKQLIDRGANSRDGSDHYPVVVYLKAKE